MSATDNDQAVVLLGKIAAQDAAAMEAFYREYARQVYAFALRQLGRPGDAEDIVIDTMYEVLAEVATIQSCPENTVKTRLFHAKRNLKRCLERRLRSER